MLQTIKAEEQNLKRIFSNDYLFEIPPYQRPYTWTTNQVAELLDDLRMAIGDNAPKNVEKISPYFLGSIVLIKNPEDSLAKVVDGQQRLTTLTILFCVLRELSEEDKSRSDIDKYVCERGDKFEGTQDRFRLNLRDRDQEFFRDMVQKRKQLDDFMELDTTSFTDSRKRMHENAAYLMKNLSNLKQSERDDLTKFLVQRCYLVVVSASDEDSAYRVFSVMNARGLDLFPTDILKAEIIGALPKMDRAKYTNLWEEIEEDLGREDFRDLFAHIRMIYVKKKAKGTLNKEFMDGVLKKINGSKFIDDVLVPLSEAYQIVSNADYESTKDAEKVNTCLEHLGRLDNYDWIPPAIAFFKENRNDGDVLIEFFRDLERLAYALFITRENVNNRINRYVRVLNEIEKDEDLYDDSSALQLTKREKSRVLNSLDEEIYTQIRIRAPLLLRLDSLLADKGATYDQKVLSIEHVLPQNPEEDSTWMKSFPEEKDREYWTHRLANLVLLSRRKNTQARNYDFERKKNEYFKRKGVTTFALTSQVLNESEWTPALLKKRQKKLIKKLRSEWRLK